MRKEMKKNIHIYVWNKLTGSPTIMVTHVNIRNFINDILRNRWEARSRKYDIFRLIAMIKTNF